MSLNECNLEKQTSRIAVLIPVFNEELVIGGTIEALVNAGSDVVHIYIVDDRSTDNTRQIAINLGVNVFTVPQNGGKALAQIAALRHFKLTSNYDWVVFLDGDTKVDRIFLQEIQKAITTDPTVGLFVGQVKSANNSHIFSASRAYEYTYAQDITKIGQDNFGVVFVAPGCSSAYRSDLLDRLQIDQMTLAEDMDLTMQVHRAGERVSYVHTAIVYTQDPSTLVDYHKQVLRWYRGFWQVVLKHELFSFRMKQRVDIYLLLLLTEALVCNRIFLGAITAFVQPASLPWLFAIDGGIAFLIALYAAYKTKRLDVVYKFPLYYWVSYINFYTFNRSFVEIILLRRELLVWNKVKRYKFDKV